MLPSSFHLSDNPFSTAPRPPLIWADRAKFKADIESALRFTMSTTPSRIIACIYGEYGAGKTHAMKYFSNPETLRGISEPYLDRLGGTPLVIPVVYPTGDVVKSLYLSMLKEMGIARIKTAVEQIIDPSEMVPFIGAPSEKLKEIVADEYLARVLSKVSDDKMPVERFLYAKITSKEQTMLGVPRPIETYEERVDTISGIMRLLTNTIAPRLIFWIDDVERISEGSGKDMYEFQHFIRDILDKVPEKLVIVMNFTFSPAEEVGERLAFLGEAVHRRISRILEIADFTKDSFLDYVSELIVAARSEDAPSDLDKYHPFDESSLIYTFETWTRRGLLTPRDVNLHLSTILEMAMNQFDELENNRVTRGFVESISKDVFVRRGGREREFL
ncbi:MAG: hypothetical protein ACFFER_05665 [Candidatus Thorarchaeota archaeon]